MQIRYFCLYFLVLFVCGALVSVRTLANDPKIYSWQSCAINLSMMRGPHSVGDISDQNSAHAYALLREFSSRDEFSTPPSGSVSGVSFADQYSRDSLLRKVAKRLRQIQIDYQNEGHDACLDSVPSVSQSAGCRGVKISEKVIGLPIQGDAIWNYIEEQRSKASNHLSSVQPRFISKAFSLLLVSQMILTMGGWFASDAPNAFKALLLKAVAAGVFMTLASMVRIAYLLPKVYDDGFFKRLSGAENLFYYPDKKQFFYSGMTIPLHPNYFIPLWNYGLDEDIYRAHQDFQTRRWRGMLPIYRRDLVYIQFDQFGFFDKSGLPTIVTWLRFHNQQPLPKLGGSSWRKRLERLRLFMKPRLAPIRVR